MKIKNKINISNTLQKELSDYTTKFCKNIATIVRDELTNTTMNAIAYFYTSWTPKTYERHYYNFMDYSFKKYYANPHNSIIRGGVELTPYRMKNIYEDPVSEVFDLVYHGFHGASAAINGNSPIMKPHPLDRIINYRDAIVKNISLYEIYGYKNASGKYNTFTTF